MDGAPGGAACWRTIEVIERENGYQTTIVSAVEEKNAPAPHLC